MSLFTRYAMDALMKTSHPEIDRKQCWNLMPTLKQCSDCMDICPHGEDIFRRPNLVKDWSACTDCGLCVAACRTRCVAPSPEQVTRDTSPADLSNDTVWIGCDRSARHNDLVRDCICALSWETLAYLALNKKLVLDLTPCGECENDLCAEKLRATLTRLVEFFGQPLFEARFTLAYEQEDAPYQQKNISRREMFGQVTDSSRNGTRQLLRMLPGLGDEDRGHSLDFRLMLNQRMKQIKASTATPVKYGFHMPAINEKCFGCGRCEKNCRPGAIKLEDLPDGTSRIVLTPWKCTECGHCVIDCNNHAIDGMKLRQVTTLGPVSIYKFKRCTCAECGKPIAPGAPDGICNVCRIRAKTKKRQEEVAELARKRREEREAKRAAEEAARKAAAEAIDGDPIAAAAKAAEAAAAAAPAAVPAAAPAGADVSANALLAAVEAASHAG